MNSETKAYLDKWGPPPTEYIITALASKGQVNALNSFFNKYPKEVYELLYLYRTYVDGASSYSIFRLLPTKIATWMLCNLQYWAKHKTTRHLLFPKTDRNSKEWIDSHCTHISKKGIKCNRIRYEGYEHCIDHLYSHGCIQIVDGKQCGNKVKIKGYCYHHLPSQHNERIKNESKHLTFKKQNTTIYKKPNYYEYIQSEKWKEKAKSARRRAGNRCQLCNRNDMILDVHHRTYERLGNEDDMDLIVLCRECHYIFETNSKNRPSKRKTLNTHTMN